MYLKSFVVYDFFYLPQKVDQGIVKKCNKLILFTEEKWSENLLRL